MREHFRVNDPCFGEFCNFAAAALLPHRPSQWLILPAGSHYDRTQACARKVCWLAERSEAFLLATEQVSSPLAVVGSSAGAAPGAVVWATTFAFIIFLIWGTGLATDDYVFLLQGLTQSVADNLWPSIYISEPVLHYTSALPYFAIGNHIWGYDVLKAAYVSAGVYAAYRFFSLFSSPRRALVLAVLFVFLPLYDAIDYSVANLYLLIGFSCYLYAYVLGAKNRFGATALVALVGSFACYGTMPIAFGLALLAFLETRHKLIWALLIPNFIYIAYYLFTSLVLKVGAQRLTGRMSFAALAKQMLVQVASCLDATVGPSAWSKLYYSIASLNLTGAVIALLVGSAVIVYLAKEHQQSRNGKLLAAAATVLVLSFGMFSLTGRYPQMAFSLGDRVMIYAGFFIVCGAASVSLHRYVEWTAVVVLSLAIVGISTHWKNWKREVDKVALNIRNNDDIRKLPSGARLYVSGHQYSLLGPYSHIDFFTADYVAQTFFKLQLGAKSPLQISSFNRRLILQDHQLRDRKYGNVTDVGRSGIWLYDSQRDLVEKVDPADIQKRLDALPEDIRHWTQEVKNERFKEFIRWLAPSLRYAYQ
jgi:hypothetical protein